MGLIFANPWGFLGLLGIPAVLLIHSLQQRSQIRVISSLFLVEKLTPESVGGRHFQRLIQSIPFWFQILMVLILSWLLAEPRWINSETRQEVAVILDSSISMQAFQEESLSVIQSELAAVDGAAAKTRWMLLESDVQKTPLYKGAKLSELLNAAREKWQPAMSGHDLAPAVQLARSLIGSKGIIIVVTDHDNPVPEGTGVLAVGRAFENVGFAGLWVESKAGSPEWRAIIRNYGTTTQTRNWYTEIAGQRSHPKPVTLEPGQGIALGGSFPGGVKELALVLDKDRFEIDDRMPLLQPETKKLIVTYQGTGERMNQFFKQVHQVIPGLILPELGERPDLQVMKSELEKFRSTPGHILGFADLNTSEEGTFKRLPVGTDHRLVEGLGWQNLLCIAGPHIDLQQGERVLVWQGDRPLVLLREEGRWLKLFFNFNFDRSNALRIPAVILAVNRFVEEVRGEIVGYRAENVELHQLIGVTSAKGEDIPEALVEKESGTLDMKARQLRAPDLPGFFSVKQGEDTLFRGAAYFADVREGNFLKSESKNTLKAPVDALVERNSREDAATPFWMIALGGLLFFTWFWEARKR